jgi:hypothetical protein
MDGSIATVGKRNAGVQPVPVPKDQYALGRIVEHCLKGCKIGSLAAEKVGFVCPASPSTVAPIRAFHECMERRKVVRDGEF